MKTPAVLCAIGALALLPTAAPADTLDILEHWYNPDLSTGFTEFMDDLPSWVDDQGLAHALLNQPMTLDWTGLAMLRWKRR